MLVLLQAANTTDQCSDPLALLQLHGIAQRRSQVSWQSAQHVSGLMVLLHIKQPAISTVRKVSSCCVSQLQC